MQQLAQDSYRPQFHFSPPYGWMNDPNGLVFINGEYHLSYQYYPFGNKWGPMHWGHAVSADLYNWHHLPPSLVPDEAGMCFSGSAIVDWRNDSGLFDDCENPGVLAFYTACIASTEDSEGSQSQALAFSKDGGFSFEKVSHNPILANSALTDFRDPKVIWHEESQHWIMVVTEGQEIGFYRSLNLKEWEKTSTFGACDGAHDGMPWECPDLFPIRLEGSDECYWVLVVGIQRASYAGGSGTQYFVGQFDGKHFVNHHRPEEVLWMDYGRDFYAAQTWSDTQDGERTAIAWMSNWLYAMDVPTQHWRSAMSAPRQLSLVSDVSDPAGLRLAQRLPNAWQSSAQQLEERGIEQGQFFTVLPAGEGGIAGMELVLAEQCRLELTAFGDGSLIYVLERDHERLTLTSIRRAVVSGEDKYQDNFAHEVVLDISAMMEEGRLPLTLVKDTCSVEWFIGDGTHTVTDLAFPELFGSMSLLVRQGHCHVQNITISQLEMNGGTAFGKSS